jgi:non-ribosomal peptide synthetase component F
MVSEQARPTGDFYPWERSMPDRLARPKNPFEPFPASDVETSISQRFERMVARYPDRLAVKDAVREITYEGLNRIANTLAWKILAGNDAPDPRRVICTELDSGA